MIMKKSRTKKENCHLLCIHTARTGVVCSTKVERNDSGTQKISCCTSFQLDLFLFLSLFFDILNSLTWISIFYTSRVRWQSTKKPESAEKKWSLFLIFSLCVQKEEKKMCSNVCSGFCEYVLLFVYHFILRGYVSFDYFSVLFVSLLSGKSCCMYVYIIVSELVPLLCI